MALGQLGILEELRERDTVSASHYVFDSAGAILGCKFMVERMSKH